MMKKEANTRQKNIDKSMRVCYDIRKGRQRSWERTTLAVSGSRVRIPYAPPEKSTHLSTKTNVCFFQRNKSLTGFVKCTACVKYAPRVKCAAARQGIYFISHYDRREQYFTMCDSTLFHIRPGPNISLKNSPQQLADDMQGLRLDLFVKVCYNTLKGSDYICEANASYRRKARRTLFLNSTLHSKKQVKRGIGLSFCTGQVISMSQLSKHYPQNVLL